MFGYGVKDNKLSEEVIPLAYQYTKQRLWMMCSYDLSDVLNHDVIRSKLHCRIAEALDCDLEFVDIAFNKSILKINNKVVETEEDLIKVFDSFCENLLEVALREDPKDRHPDHPQLLELPI